MQATQQHPEEPFGITLHIKPVSSPQLIKTESETARKRERKGKGGGVTSPACLAVAIPWIAGEYSGTGNFGKGEGVAGRAGLP